MIRDISELPPGRHARADRADIGIGNTVIRPSTREVEGPGGRDSLEPRVMEVLLVLIDAGGALVSRDALIERCWGGRVVGEDAITRVISKIRRLSEGVAAGDFTLETISKAGYRLHAAPAPGEPPTMLPPAITTRRRRLAAGIAAAVVLAATGWWATTLRHEPPAATARRNPAAATLPADPAARDLEIRGRALVFEGSPDETRQGIGYLREAANLAPNDAEGWGGLAMGQVRSLAHTPLAGQPAVVLRIRDAAARALALDHHEALATAALASLEPTFGNWPNKDAVLSQALASARGNRTAVLFQRAQFLGAVGRTREALTLVEQASAMSPLLPWIQAVRIDLLATEGRLEDADRVAARAENLWPRDHRIWLTRYFLKLFNGRAGEALGMATNRAGWPEQGRPEDFALAAQAAQAFVSGSPATVDAVVAALARHLAVEPGYAEQAIRIAAALGRTEPAFAFVDQAYLRARSPWAPSRFDYTIGFHGPGERNTAPLFAASSSRLWSDPRFMPAMERMGLAAYWRQSVPPDFCARVAACVSAVRSGRRSPAGR